MLRDTLENWQPKFLQLIWQIGGLAFLFYVGSPQSKEGDDHMEAKIDADYAGRHTDQRWRRLAREGSRRDC